MQSVYVFTSISPDRLSAELDRAAERSTTAAQWLFPSAQDVRLRIEVASDMIEELEPEVAGRVRAALGSASPRCIVVDVLRQSGALKAIVSFMLELLSSTGGVVMDDNSDLLWSHDDLVRGVSKDGHAFAEGY